MSLDKPLPTQRMQWLDAMRGFTMILVVTCHVLNISYGINNKSSVCQNLFLLFRMPLFFFVSGFLAYRAKNIWTGGLLKSQLTKKLKVQIIPALIFFIINISLFYKDISNAFLVQLQSPMKGGYWFTWVLLHMFIIYYLLEYLAERSKRWGRMHININVLLGVVWVIALIGYVILFMPPLMKQLPAEFKTFLNASSMIKTIELLQFFIAGNIIHRNWNRVTRLFDSKWFYPVIILIALIVCSDFLVWHNLKFMWRNLPRTIATYSLLIIVVCFFRNYERWFTKDTRIGQAMQYIGTRTLDIYLIHYFFLPKMPQVGVWLNRGGNNFVLDLTTGVSMALLIVAFSLIVSNLLRVSPFLSELLFGRKITKNTLSTPNQK